MNDLAEASAKRVRLAESAKHTEPRAEPLADPEAAAKRLGEVKRDVVVSLLKFAGLPTSAPNVLDGIANIPGIATLGDLERVRDKFAVLPHAPPLSADDFYEALDAVDFWTGVGLMGVIQRDGSLKDVEVIRSITDNLISVFDTMYISGLVGYYPLKHKDLGAQIAALRDSPGQLPPYAAELIDLVKPLVPLITGLVEDSMVGVISEEAFDRVMADPDFYGMQKVQPIDNLGTRNFHFRTTNTCPLWHKYDYVRILGGGHYGLAVLYTQHEGTKPGPEGPLKVVKFEVADPPGGTKRPPAFAVECRLLYEISVHMTSHWSKERKLLPTNHIALYDYVMCSSDIRKKFAPYLDDAQLEQWKSILSPQGRAYQMTVQEFAPDGTLGDAMANADSMRRICNDTGFASLLVQLFGTLQALGEVMHFSHLDLKPVNILLARAEPSIGIKYLAYHIRGGKTFWVPLTDSNMVIYKIADLGLSYAELVRRAPLREGRPPEATLTKLASRSYAKFLPSLDLEVFIAWMVCQACDIPEQVVNGFPMRPFMTLFGRNGKEAMRHAFVGSAAPDTIKEEAAKKWSMPGYEMSPPFVTRQIVSAVLNGNLTGHTPEKVSVAALEFYQHAQRYWTRNPEPHHPTWGAYDRMFASPLFDRYRNRPLDAVDDQNVLVMNNYAPPAGAPRLPSVPMGGRA